MIRRALGMSALFVLVSIAGGRAQEPDTKAARAAVDSWLSLIDAADYAKSWDESATSFKNAITSEKWQAAVKTRRGTLGTLKSRTVKSATPATNPPGAPEGEYVAFDFDAIFEHKPAAAERVTVIRDKDGAWRVVGYFVK
jgi:hypothetical protein